MHLASAVAVKGLQCSSLVGLFAFGQTSACPTIGPEERVSKSSSRVPGHSVKFKVTFSTRIHRT